jgi:phospholipid-translocating ATPase
MSESNHIPLLDLSEGSSYVLRSDPKTFHLPLHHSSISFQPNVIRNQKYNIFTFLPVVLYEQFKFFFNLYFLMNTLTQLIPALRVGYLFTLLGPLLFVLLITIAKEAHDDYKRYQRDVEANSQIYEKLTENGNRFNGPDHRN